MVQSAVHQCLQRQMWYKKSFKKKTKIKFSILELMTGKCREMGLGGIQAEGGWCETNAHGKGVFKDFILMTHDKWVFVGCVVDNYFLQVATTLSFHAFFFFWEPKLPILMKSNLLIAIKSKNSLLQPCLENFCFSLKCLASCYYVL